MVVAGQLRPDADLDHLALATLASLQGGLLLSKTTRTTVPIEVALDAAIAHLRTYAVESAGRPRSIRRAMNVADPRARLVISDLEAGGARHLTAAATVDWDGVEARLSDWWVR